MTFPFRAALDRLQVIAPAVDHRKAMVALENRLACATTPEDRERLESVVATYRRIYGGKGG